MTDGQAQRCMDVYKIANKEVWRIYPNKLKQMGCERMSNLFSTINNFYDEFEGNCRRCENNCVYNTIQEIKGMMVAARLKLYCIMKEMKCLDIPQNLFSEKDEELYKKISETINPYVTEDMIIILLNQPRQINAENNLYEIKKYMDNLYELGNREGNPFNSYIRDVTDPSLITFLNSQLQGEFEKINRAFGNILKGSDFFSLMRIFVDYENVITRSGEERKKAEEIYNKLEKEWEEKFVPMLKEKENEIFNMRVQITQLEKDINENKINTSEVEKQRNELEKVRTEMISRFEEYFKNLNEEYISNFKSRISDLERMKNELVETIARETRESAKMQIENEIQILSQESEKYRKALEEIEATKKAEENEIISKVLFEKENGEVVTGPEAAAMEEAILGKIRMNIEEYKKSGKSLDELSLGEILLKDNAEEIRRIGGNPSSTLPSNKSVSVPLKKGLLFKNMEGIITAIFYSNLDEYVAKGYSDSKGSIADVNTIINELSKREEDFVVVGIISPTGWDKKSIDYIKSFEGSTTKVHACLIDGRDGKIFYNSANERLHPYINLLSPITSNSVVHNAKEKIEDEIKKRRSEDKYLGYITMEEANEIFEIDPYYIQIAFSELVKTNRYNKIEDEIAGTVLVEKI
ncbi:MAG: hypothetical protein ACP5UL_05205 [Thermoplasmata archaeon]